MIERLNESLEEVERSLTGTVDVARLARIAATSEYHYRRMFAALAGMPLSEYVRRRRLTVASAEVLAGRGTLLDVALRYGYTSADAFARAFRQMHGVTPAEARRGTVPLQSQPKMTFRLTIEGSTSMEYRIVEKPAFSVAGKKARVTLIYEGENPGIMDFVRGIPQETSARIAALSDQEPRGILAITDSPDDPGREGIELDYYHAALTSGDVPDDLDTLDVPAGTWAVFHGEGTMPESAQYLWRDSYAEWFPSNPYRMRPGPSLLRVEYTGESTGKAELWLPVEPEEG